MDRKTGGQGDKGFPSLKQILTTFPSNFSLLPADSKPDFVAIYKAAYKVSSFHLSVLSGSTMFLLLLLSLLPSLSFSASNWHPHCPGGYTSYTYYDSNGNINYACYKVFITYYTRQAAQARCAQDGAFLPSIISAAENQYFVDSDPFTGSLFIGLSCYDANDCAFDDLTPFNTTSFSGFRNGQIRYDLGECVVLETLGAGKGIWSNVPCSMVGSFVCKYVPESQIALSSGCDSYYAITISKATITSPFYPNYYEQNMICVYAFNFNANITFLDFELANPQAYVRIYDGGYATQNQTLLASYTGWIIPPSVVTTSGSGMIIFQSSYASGEHRGFKAYINRIWN